MIVEKDFKEFIELLNNNKVKYLIVGGFGIVYKASIKANPYTNLAKRAEIIIEKIEVEGR